MATEAHIEPDIAKVHKTIWILKKKMEWNEKYRKILSQKCKKSCNDMIAFYNPKS